MFTFYKPRYLLLLWLTLLSTTTTIQAQNYEQRSSTFDALFKFEVVRGSGNLTDSEIENWSFASSEFFAAMFDQLNDENTTTPMLAPGVIIQVTQQERYIASTGNFGQINYGVSLEVNFVVTYQTNPSAPALNVANQVLRIFDRDDKGNLVFFSPYLSALRFSVGSATFSSVNKMSMNVNGPQDIDLPSPIPTLPLPPPTETPTMAPSKTPTVKPTLPPTESPSVSPTPRPTPLETFPSIPPTQVLLSQGPSLGEPVTQSPTSKPTTPNPTAPDETFAPTVEPDPTESPTKNPTAPPTLPLDSFFAINKLNLVGVEGNLDFNATLDFQEVTSNYLFSIIQDLLRDTTVVEVIVGLSSQTLVKPDTATDANEGGGTRRRLQASKQEEPSKLQVEFNTRINIRSTTSVNAPSLVSSAFGTEGRRENYRRLLLASGDEILNTITRVELDGSGIVDRSKSPLSPSDSGGLGTAALVGIGVGASLFAIAILGIWYKANNNSGKGDDGDSQKGQIPTAQMSDNDGRLTGRLDAEIVVNKQDDDVSTLGDPFFGMSLEERTCADKTATSASVQQSYDFMKLMGKGQNALLGTTTEGQEDDEEEETASKVRRNTLFADDDASFEDMFGEMR